MMKKLLIAVLVLVVVSPICAFGVEKELVGTVKSLYTVMTGKDMVDMADPRAELVKNFVLVTPEKKNYYIVGVDSRFLNRVLNQEIKIRGDVKDQYESINAEQVYVKKGNDWKLIWDWTAPGH